MNQQTNKREKMTVSEKWKAGFIKYGLKKGFIKSPLENEEEKSKRLEKVEKVGLSKI